MHGVTSIDMHGVTSIDPVDNVKLGPVTVEVEGYWTLHGSPVHDYHFMGVAPAIVG